MAINPNDVTTVQVKDLPPNPFSLTDNIPHEVGDILSRGTIGDFVNFITAQSKAFKYEIKYIRAPDTQYINDNFDMTPNATQGIGKVGGIYEGWAICNGNNGTDNIDGHTLIGYGANYAAVGQFLGSKDTVLVSHTHITNPNTNISTGTGDGVVRSRAVAEVGGTGLPINVTLSTVGESGIGKNIQPSMVILMIMKIV